MLFRSKEEEHCIEKPNNVKQHKFESDSAEFAPVQDLVEREEQQEKKYMQNHRWSTYELHFARGDKKVKRLFANLQQAKLTAGDMQPMYTSFLKSNGL